MGSICRGKEKEIEALAERSKVRRKKSLDPLVLKRAGMLEFILVGRFLPFLWQVTCLRPDHPPC
jgi:hypothetical protein